MIYFKLGSSFLLGLIVILVGVSSANPPMNPEIMRTVTPTATPSSDIPQAGDSDSQIAGFLLQFDEDCLSPCWWGLEMGLTVFDEWDKLFNQFSPLVGPYVTSPEVSQFIAKGADVYSFGNAYNVVLVALDGEIIGTNQFYPIFWDIEDTATSRRYVKISDVLETYGTPDEITFSFYGNEFILQIEFLDKGIILEYFYRPQDVLNENSDGLYFCPHQTELGRLHIYTVLPGEAFAEHIPVEPSINTRPIEEITEFTLETFAEELIQNQELCLDIPFEKFFP
jgi:hypothetical protein